MREVWRICGIVGMVVGCEARDAAPPGSEAAEAPPAPAREPAAGPVAEPAAPAPPDPATLPSPPEPGGAGQAGNLQTERLRRMGEALAAAAAAADEAGAEGESHCERAYNGAAAMARALHERMGVGGEARLPSRDRFIQGCNELPEPVQRCMNVAYSISHQEECRRLRESDPQLMDRVQALLGQARGG